MKCVVDDPRVLDTGMPMVDDVRDGYRWLRPLPEVA